MITMKKILLIEDDPFVADIYRTQLAKEGYKTNVAKDGRMALQKAKDDPPDLMVLDIILPDMDGWEVLKAVRSDSRTKDIKVIALSNLSREQYQRNVDDLGVMKYFVKIETSPDDVIDFIKKNIE